MMKNIINNIKKHITKYKLLVGIISILIIMLIISELMSGKNDNNVSINRVSSHSYQDQATGDDTAESLNALTQELHRVIKSNEDLQGKNEQLSKKNSKILSNLREEVQQTLTEELKERGEDNKEKIKQLENKLQEINATIGKTDKHDGHSNNGKYTIDGQTAQANMKAININGQTLISANTDVSDSNTNDVSKNTENDSLGNSASLLHPNGKVTAVSYGDKRNGLIPYYTIPNGATLARSVTMSALIGRVPVDGVVKSPYPFKMIIGNDDMAANGHTIPGISGAIVQGYLVGDMALSCVKGYVTTITFVFPDGTISTTKDDSANDSSSLGFNNSLGYLSAPNGNTCFHGKFYTNAPAYLRTIILLGAINRGGQYYSAAQETTSTNGFGGVTSALTGSVGKAMLGGAVQGATEQAMNWYTEREKNSFDAVYVPSGKHAVINITKQIDVDYNPHGRKLYYEHSKKINNDHSLN